MTIFNKINKHGFLLGFLFLLSGLLQADNTQSCTSTFTDGLGTLNGGGTIDLGYNASIYNSPNNALAANQINTNAGSSVLSCHPQTCTTNNTITALTLPDFEYHTGNTTLFFGTNDTYIFDGTVTNFEEIHANSKVSLTFNAPIGGVYKIGKLYLGSKNELYLSAGDYYIQEFSGNSKLKVHIIGSGTVRIYTEEETRFNSHSEINSLNGLEGDPNKLIWTNYKGMSLNSQSVFSGFIYAKEDVLAHSPTIVYGAVTAQNIQVNANSSIYYSSPDIASADFGELCTFTAPSIVDHFDFNASQSSSTCPGLYSNIIIQAKDSNGDILTNYTGTITLSTTSGHGDWHIDIANGNLIDAIQDDGLATYEFAASDQGQISLNLSNAHADTLSVNVKDNETSKHSDSASIEFSNNTFIVEPDSIQIAGKPLAIKITLIQTDSSNNQCSTALNYNQSTLKAWIEPSTQMNNANAPSLNNIVLNKTQPSNSTELIRFNNGVANIVLTNNDVNQFTFHIKDEVSGYAQNIDGSNKSILGQSNQITLSPFYINMSFANDSNANNSLAVDATGSKFKKVDEEFLLTVKPVLWESADDSNADGILDANASTSNNALIPSFNLTSEMIEISATKNLPLLGVNGILNGVLTNSDFSALSYDYLMSYSEVGTINLTATITNNGFLNTNNKVESTLFNVGRFVPDHFQISQNNVNLVDALSACNITYQGQNFTLDADVEFTISAHNKTGQLVNNYADAFNQLDTTKLTPNLQRAIGSLSMGSEPVTSWANPVLSNHLDYDGSFVVSIRANSIVFPKTNTSPLQSDLPFTANLNATLNSSQLTDSDGVCLNQGSTCSQYISNDITGATIAYAIATLSNTTSSELKDAKVPVQLKIWATKDSYSNFHNITSDSCTDFAISDFEFLSCRQDSGSWCLLNYSNTLSTPHNWSGLANGEGQVHIKNPSENNTGQIALQLNVPSYLQYNFFGNGLESPKSTVYFGQANRGNSLIYISDQYK